MGNNNMEERLLDESKEVEESSDVLKVKVFEESKKIWKVALPSVLARLSAFGSVIVTQSFIGHIGSLELAAYALVQTLSVRFVNGILIGMSSATETLCGQAYGAKQYHMMGVYLQRSWIVDFITLTILLPVFIFGTQIFKLLREQSDIAEEAGIISYWFIPFIYNYVFSLTMQMYLQAQQKNRIVGYLSIAKLIIHIPLSWLFVNVLGWGVGGPLAVISLSSWFVVVGELIYVFGGWCPQTWQGFTMAAFKDILPVVKLSISSGIMLCLELWYNAVLVLLAGYMEDAEVSISAFSICLNINVWEFMISLGLLGAACVRVSNELGRGDAKAVIFSIKVLVATSVLIGLFFFAMCLIFGRKVGYLFTNEEAVVDAVADLSTLLSLSILLNSVAPIISGVAVGAGLQLKVAYINLICYYFIGIPIGIVLGYVAKLQVKGIWIGMICGLFTQTLALIYMMWRIDWDEEVAKASERLKRFDLIPSHDKNGSSTLA